MTVAAISAAAGNALLYAWFATVLVSAVYVAYDAFTNNPELTVMKWGWVLVTLYVGPIGASIYVLSCKEPAQGRTSGSWRRCGSSRLDPRFTAWRVTLREPSSPRS